MNTIIGYILLFLIVRSFIKLLLQEMREEKKDKQEEVEIWERINYNKKKSA